MKKGAIYGIVAAFIIIAMLIFIPVIVNNSTPSAETASSASGADLTDPGTETTEPTVTDSADTTETVSKESDDAETVHVTETEEETTETFEITETETEEETTTAEVTTATEETTTAEQTTTAEVTTAAEVTTKEPETETEETTTAPVTTKRPETEPPETTSVVTTTRAKPLEPEKKYVAFTFDDGPHPENSKKITDKLLEYGGKGTFFVIGNLIYGDREAGMKYAYEHGMEIAIHCWSHEHYYTKEPEYYHDEVYKAADAIKNSIGVWPILMRPPGGNITEEQYKSSEFAVIIWDVDSNDWRYKSNKERSQRENIDIIVKNIMDEVKPGSIILMHEIYENSYLAFCEVIEKLADQGYEFVTVSELLQNPETGFKYYSANYKKG